MVRLHKIKMVNFGPFLDETIVFPEKGLVLLDGESGHGKSTVLVAIAYALDIAPSEYTSTALQNWHGGPMQVVLTVVKDGQLIDIAKGKRSYIRYGDGAEKTGSKAVQEELQKIFGVAPDLLSVMVYRPQKTSGLFLSRTDTDKKAFLSTVLNLDAVEQAIDVSTENIKKLEYQIEAANDRLANFDDLVAPPERPVLRSTELFRDDVTEAFEKVTFHEQKLFELQKQLKSIALELVEANRERAAKIEAQVADAQATLADLQTKDQVKHKEFEKARKALQNEWYSLDAEHKRVKSLRVNIKELQNEISQLEVGKCFTCHQDWDKSAYERSHLEQILHDHQKQLEGLPGLEAKASAVAARLDDLGTFTPNPTIEKLQIGIAKANASIRELKSGSMNDPEFARCQQNVQSTTTDYYKAKTYAAGLQKDLENIEAQNALLQAEYQKDLEHYNDMQVVVESKRAELRALEARLNEERDFKDALGTSGFLGLIFDEVLNEISTETNRYLATLRNVSHVTIGFRSESLNTKGAIKRSIVPVVTVNGHEASLKAGVSGGMGTSIEMSVDFGVLKVVERRCGAAPGWLALDECFTGQPPSTKEAAMEILAQHANDRLILVVDHSSEFKELFTKTIRIVMENGVSRVQ